MKITAFYVSPGHNYFDRHGLAPGEHPVIAVPAVECVAGRGLVGERFLDYKEDYVGRITFFAGEVYDGICQALNCAIRPAAVFRRNVLTRRAGLQAAIGQGFEVQGVCFLGSCERSPCYWMGRAFASGAAAWLKGRGGLRAGILTSGWLQVDAPC